MKHKQPQFTVTAERKFKANFLWPCDDNSIEEAGFEFANSNTRNYQWRWWKILVRRIRKPLIAEIRNLKAANKRLAKFHRDHP